MYIECVTYINCKHHIVYFCRSRCFWTLDLLITFARSITLLHHTPSTPLYLSESIPLHAIDEQTCYKGKYMFCSHSATLVSVVPRRAAFVGGGRGLGEEGAAGDVQTNDLTFDVSDYIEC